MTTVARFDGDCRITGNLQVDGTLPTYSRSELAQDANSEFAIPLTDARVWDNLASLLPSAGANDDLGIYDNTFGTDGPSISTGDLKAAGATSRYARFQIRLPAEYDAGQTVTLRISSGMETTVADTTSTIDVECYKLDREIGIGSDICATAAQSNNSLTFADLDFSITPTGLTAGDMLDVRITAAVNDGATGTAVISSIGAIELLCDIKG